MPLTAKAVSVDCADALKVATFWSAAMNRPLGTIPPPGEFFARIEEGKNGPTMMFLQVPEPRPGKNRVHLDLVSDDRPVEIARLVELGATEGKSYDEYGTRWTTLQDPEGNEFCVADPH